MGEKFTKKPRQLPTSNSNVAHHNQIYFNPTSISVSSHQTSNYVSTDEESNETTLVEDIKIEHGDNKLNIITLNETNDANKLDDLVFNLTTNDDKQQITGAYSETLTVKSGNAPVWIVILLVVSGGSGYRSKK